MTTPAPSAAFIRLTTFVCGALVMVVEILGSRVLGPFFGVGLYVWTALITVTLAALAGGYALGGRLADRPDPAATLYTVILLSGLFTLAIPLLTPPALNMGIPLGMRLGALICALILFGPTLFLLGCVSPLVVRVAMLDPHRLGRTVGNLYALSTLGSVVGALLTGFILIATLGVNRIFQLTGVVLVALALLYFIFSRHRRMALAALALPALLLPPQPASAYRLPNGGTLEVVDARETFHGSLKVIDSRLNNTHRRELAMDGLIQGGLDMTNGLSFHRYGYFMTFLPMGYHPHGSKALVVGLGAGIIPRWFAQQGVTVDVVDIDPAVVELAKTHFNFQPNGRVFIQDARNFLVTHPDRYDYLLVDVFTGDTTPGHMLSVEAIRLMAQRLTPQGVLGINLIGNARADGYMTASIVRTVAEVFDHTDLRAVYDVEEDPHAVDNLILVAYQGPQRTFDDEIVRRHPVHPAAREAVFDYLPRPVTFPPGTPAMLLTDDYNPIDFYDAKVKERLREMLVDYKNWRILMAAR